MPENWISQVANGGLFGVIAALIYMLMAKDKVISELRIAISELSTAIALMTEAIRVKGIFDDSETGMLKSVMSVQKDILSNQKEMLAGQGGIMKEMSRCFTDLGKAVTKSDGDKTA